MSSAELAEECGKAAPDVDRVKELCRAAEGIPAELRGKILLGVHNKRANLDVPPGHEGLTPEDQQTIRADVARTRQTVDSFKTEKVQADLELLLTVYCKRRSVKYTQGLNELIAPFFLLDLDQGAIFNCFYGLMVKFLPNMLRGHDLKTLRRGLSMFGLLLQYHLPDIHGHLSESGVNPDLYATSWFVTLFAGDSSIPVVLALWDEVLIREDPFFVYFVALALLGMDRESILAMDIEFDLMEHMRRIKMSSPADVAAATVAAEEYDRETPRCFRRQLYRATVQNEANSDMDEMLLTAPCICVPASELAADSGSVRFFVIDCRPLEEFVKASLPTAVNLDLASLTPNEAHNKVDSFKAGLAGQHLCIMGGDHCGPARVAVGILVAAKFERISFMEQGFQACAALYEKGELELVSESGVVDVSSSRPEAGGSGLTTLLAGLSGLGGGVSKEGDAGDAAVDVAERVKEEAMRVKDKAKEAVIKLQNDPRVQQAAEKTKEKAKEWGQRGMGFLSSALSKALTVAGDIKERTANAGAAQSLSSGWTEIAGGGDAGTKFTIEDDLEEVEGPGEGRGGEAGADDAEGFAQDTPINVGHWMQKPNTEFFPCKRVLASGQSVTRYLVVTPTHLMDLESHKSKANVAKLKAWNGLGELDKITFNKKDNDVITFIFKARDGGRPRGYIYVLRKEALTRAVEMIQANLKKIKAAVAAQPMSLGGGEGQTHAGQRRAPPVACEGDLLELGDGGGGGDRASGGEGDLLGLGDEWGGGQNNAPPSLIDLSEGDPGPAAEVSSGHSADLLGVLVGGDAQGAEQRGHSGGLDLLGGALEIGGAPPRPSSQRQQALSHSLAHIHVLGGGLDGGGGGGVDLLGGLAGSGVEDAGGGAAGGVLGFLEDELDWLKDVAVDEGAVPGGEGDDDDVPDWLKD